MSNFDLMKAMPSATVVMRDQLNKIDKDLVSLVVVKKRVGPVCWLHGP